MLPRHLFQVRTTHRDLTSFPTRRSSDLAEAIGPRPLAGQHHRRGVRLLDDRRPPHHGAQAERVAIETRTGERSEEHTSELQSLTNIVCRLLLAKKKRKDKGKPRGHADSK